MSMIIINVRGTGDYHVNEMKKKRISNTFSPLGLYLQKQERKKQN